MSDLLCGKEILRRLKDLGLFRKLLAKGGGKENELENSEKAGGCWVALFRGRMTLHGDIVYRRRELIHEEYGIQDCSFGNPIKADIYWKFCRIEI